MSFVIDASVVANLVLPDEHLPEAVALIANLNGDVAVAPALWPFEVLNLLVMAQRRKRIDEENFVTAFQAATELPVNVGNAPTAQEQGEIAILSKKHSLTVYDAAYLYLSLRESLPLASKDKALIKAAQIENVKLALTI